MEHMWWNKHREIIFFLRSDSIQVVRVFRDAIEEEQTFSLVERSFEEVFRQAVERYGNTGRVVCGEEYMYVFSLSLTDDELKDESRLRALCAERVPENIESIVWDYQILRKNKNLSLVQVSGMRKDFSEQLAALFDECHFSPEGIVPESYAIAQEFLGQGGLLLCQERQGKMLLCHIDNGAVFASQVSPQEEKEANGFLEYARLRSENEIQKIIFMDISEGKDFFPKEEVLKKEYISSSSEAIFGISKLKWRLKKETAILDLKVPRRKSSWNMRFWKRFHKTGVHNDTSMQQKKGFTLIEILLVIGIIAVLATVVIVALDPAKRFADARNARRLSDIQSILAAVQQYIIDNKGTLPTGIETTEKQIGVAGGGCSISSDYCNVDTSVCVDLSSELAKYLKSVPYDPGAGSSETTHYSIQANDNNLITVTACDSTDPEIARVSR